ncbi:MAG: GNAT family N-acetyltransferase [Opitutales bacterium]
MRFTVPIGEDAFITPLDLGDASAIFLETERSRRYLREFLPWVDHVKGVEDTRRFISAESKLMFEGRKIHVTIWDEGEFAGICSLFDINKANRSATIGYWLGKRFQGKGLMTRTVKALINHAYEDLHLNRIEIRTHPENKASQAIPLRLGFKLEGTLEQAEWLYDKYVDSNVYGMTADRWKS